MSDLEIIRGSNCNGENLPTINQRAAHLTNISENPSNNKKTKFEENILSQADFPNTYKSIKFDCEKLQNDPSKDERKFQDTKLRVSSFYLPKSL